MLSKICSGQAFYCKKIKKASNSLNTGDRVMVLAFCNSPYGPLSVYQASLNLPSILLETAPDKGVMGGQMDGQTKW